MAPAKISHHRRAYRTGAVVKPLKRVLAAAGIALGLAGVFAPLAGADSRDVRFYNGLISVGVGSANFKPVNARGMAEQTCTALDAGRSVRSLVSSMLNFGHFNDTQIAHIIGGSIALYCPWHMDQLQ